MKEKDSSRRKTSRKRQKENSDVDEPGKENVSDLTHSKSVATHNQGKRERGVESRTDGVLARVNEAQRTCHSRSEKEKHRTESRADTEKRQGAASRSERQGQGHLASPSMRTGTPSRMEAASRLSTPGLATKQKQRKNAFLPEIDKKYLPRISPEKRFNPNDIEMPEGADDIQTTTNAVSFTLFFTPASNLGPIHRCHSDAVGDREPTTHATLVEVNPAKKFKSTPVCSSKAASTISGGMAMDSIREGVEGQRRTREHKNLQVTRTKLEHMEHHAARVGTPSAAIRLQEVREVQDQIREEGYINSMLNFMANIQRKK